MDLAQDGVPEKDSSVPFGDLIAPGSPASSGRDDPFRRLWELGYRKLLPLIPPDAEISPNSTLFKKVGLRQDGRGKAPGIRKPNGQWVSFDWLKHDTVETDLAQWLDMGAGIGIRTGKIDDELTLVAIDSDARDPQQAQVIFAEMERRFGTLPLRIGRDPKGLCPLLVRGPFPYSRIEFGERDENGRLIDRVEILSDDRQFVAAGTHPGTGRPYRWQRPLVPLSDLPIVEPEELTAFLDALRPLLPAASEIVGKLGSKNGTAPDQKSLIGELDRIQKAIERLPNSADIDRDEYVRIGVALKAAAGPGYEADARDMFVDWAQRWEGAGEETTLHGLAETAEADFHRFRPPFHLGAEYLFAQAIKRSGGTFTAGDAYFEKPSNVVPLFPEAPRDPVALPDASIAWTDPEAWVDKPIPAREWEVRDWIPRHEVTLLYGDGGIGKTLLMHQYAVAASAGVPWLGQETRQARVMCFFCEDGEDELQRRHADILRALGLTHADTAGRLRIASRRNTDNLMALWDRHSGAMKRQAVWEQLRSDALAFRADVVIMDTIADIFAGEEQNRAQVTSFVKGVLGRLAAEIGGSVIALGHPSQAGKASKEGTSGSTGWSNAVRSRLYLSYPSGTTSGNVRELEGKKLNYGAKGAKLKMRWNRGAFDLIASSTPVRAEGASAFPTGVVSVQAGVERDVLDAVALHPDVRMVLAGKTSPYYAPTVLKKREPDLLVAWTPDEIVAAVERLEAAGVIRSVPIGKDASRRTTYGLRVDADRLSARDAAKPGVFD